MKTESETNKQRTPRKALERDWLVRDAKALIRTFLAPAPNNLTPEQQAALDNLNGLLLEIGV